MKRRLEEFGYSLCWRGDWISRIWAPIWFAYYCPYPVVKDWRAHASTPANAAARTAAAHFSRDRA